MTELVAPASPAGDTSPAAPVDEVRQRAEQHAVRWLHGYTSAKTRNSYAVDLGISPLLRAALPGGPAKPRPPAGWAWIPWARDHGVDPAGDLTPEVVQEWVHALHDVATKNVRRRRWTALCAYYRYLRRAKVVYCDPNDLLNRRTMGLSGEDPSPTLPLTPQQIRALFLAARLATGSAAARQAAMLAVLAATGCRAEELVQLDLDDYTRNQPSGHALLLLDGKGDKKRWARLPAADADLVDAYLPGRVAPATGRDVALVGQVSARRLPAPLFTTSRGRRVHEDDVAGMLRRLCRVPRPDDPREQVRAAARLLGPIAGTIRPHQFRHAYAQSAADNGVPVHQIRADLGHASLATTQTYLHAGAVAASSASQVVSDLYHVGMPDLAEPQETPRPVTSR